MTPLELNGQPRAGADFDIRKRPKYAFSDQHERPFQIALCGDGFEATRNFTREELEDLRDWLSAALANEKERTDA